MVEKDKGTKAFPQLSAEEAQVNVSRHRAHGHAVLPSVLWDISEGQTPWECVLYQGSDADHSQMKFTLSVKARLEGENLAKMAVYSVSVNFQKFLFGVIYNSKLNGA